VERLALISPAPAWREARDQFERRFTERSMTPALQAARKELRESGLREQDPVLHQKRLFELAVAGYFHDPVRAHDLTPFRITERTQKEVWASLGEFDLRPALGGLSLPALVVHGDDDPIPVESASVVAALLGAEFHVLQNCGHVPYIEAYADFSRIVGTFLS
jgi:proline iminopeptidase